MFEPMKKTFNIGHLPVGDGQPCFIIAEAGVNHNGDPKIAEQLLGIGAQSGVDCVKFQKRTVKSILTRDKYDEPYTKPTSLGPTYGAHREKLELDEAVWEHLWRVAKKIDVLISGSVWDPASADFLDGLGVPFFKIPSADLTNLSLLEHVAKKGRPMIVSTGMATIEEIDEAVNVVSHYNDELILLHCIAAYPCEDHEVNLRIIETLRKRYSLPVGYSSHDKGVSIPSIAVTLGACVIEKHFTLDRTMIGPDHAASLEPQGLERMVKYIRHAESALGDGIKDVLEREREPRTRLAKSIVTKQKIVAGTVVTADMFTVKCPGNGLKPNLVSHLVGRCAAFDLAEDVLVPDEALQWPKGQHVS